MMTPTHIDDIPASVVITTCDLVLIQSNSQWKREFGTRDSGTLYEFATPATRIFLQTHVLPTLMRDGEVNEIYVSLLASGDKEVPVLLNARTNISGGHRRVTWLMFSARQRRTLERELMRRKQAAEEMASDLATAATELKRSNDALASFASLVTHDLKAPMRHVQRFAEILESELEGELTEDARQMLRFLKEGAKNMARITDDLHRYSLVGSNHGEFGWLEVAPFLDSVIRSMAPDRSLTFVYEGTVERLETLTVPFELVVRNLVNNAVKHHDRDDGVITACIVDEGSHYRIDVSDDGPGIAPEDHDAIFAEFGRLSAGKEGSGLGLAMVKRTVETYGGRVAVHSCLGEGARFSVWWPHKRELQQRLGM